MTSPPLQLLCITQKRQCNVRETPWLEGDGFCTTKLKNVCAPSSEEYSNVLALGLPVESENMVKNQSWAPAKTKLTALNTASLPSSITDGRSQCQESAVTRATELMRAKNFWNAEWGPRETGGSQGLRTIWNKIIWYPRPCVIVVSFRLAIFFGHFGEPPLPPPPRYHPPTVPPPTSEGWVLPPPLLPQLISESSQNERHHREKTREGSQDRADQGTTEFIHTFVRCPRQQNTLTRQVSDVGYY